MTPSEFSQRLVKFNIVLIKTFIPENFRLLIGLITSDQIKIQTCKFDNMKYFYKDGRLGLTRPNYFLLIPILKALAWIKFDRNIFSCVQDSWNSIQY